MSEWSGKRLQPSVEKGRNGPSDAYAERTTAKRRSVAESVSVQWRQGIGVSRVFSDRSWLSARPETNEGHEQTKQDDVVAQMPKKVCSRGNTLSLAFEQRHRLVLFAHGPRSFQDGH